MTYIKEPDLNNLPVGTLIKATEAGTYHKTLFIKVQTQHKEWWRRVFYKPSSFTAEDRNYIIYPNSTLMDIEILFNGENW